jgi:hypothetical protein
VGVREKADAGEEERKTPGRVEANRERKRNKEREKKLKWMPGSGRAQPGPAAAE